VNAHASTVRRRLVLRVRYGTQLFARVSAHSRPAITRLFTRTTSLHATVNAQTEPQKLAASLVGSGIGITAHAIPLLLALVWVLTQAATVMESTGCLTTWVPASAYAKSGDPSLLHSVKQAVKVWTNSSTRAHVSVKHAESAPTSALILWTITRNGAAAAQKMPTTSALVPRANTPCQTL